MKELNLPPFYVGQKVVALKSHSQGKFQKGDTYTVDGVMANFCKCDRWLISIGIKQCNSNMSHLECGSKGIPNRTGKSWFLSKVFAPVQENFQSISLEKILENETSLISAS